DHDAAALDPTGLAQSPLWGLAGNLTVEHPELRCRAVDLDPALPCASQADALSSVLLGSGDEARFALRGGQLAIERLVALAERARTEARTQLDGAWLLAGATGRVGRRLALWLAERGATTLWLVARTLADATLQRELEAL